MSKTINVGLIGFGMAGRVFHAPLIASIPQFNILKVRESKKENIEIVHQRYPKAKIVAEAKDIINDAEIDLVVVATPNVFHFPFAKEALLAGKHVIVEKPFTVTSQEAEELIEISKKQKKILTVYQNRRWDSDFLTVKKIIESKILGNLITYESTFERFRNVINQSSWKETVGQGTGLLYDLGSHLIDQTLCLFGLPSAVNCDMRIQRAEGTIIDYFKVDLAYEKLRVTLKGDFLVREPGPRFVLAGDKGGFVKHGTDIQEEELKAGLFPLERANWGVEPEALWGKLNTEVNGIHMIGKVESERGDYLALYKNVYNAIAGKEALIIKPEQARNTIKVIEHAIKSSVEKRSIPFS
jgi:scyllo-inositol 2-dehydrogenase (NADP+)